MRHTPACFVGEEEKKMFDAVVLCETSEWAAIPILIIVRKHLVLKLDTNSAFWQICIKEEDWNMDAFVMKYGFV